MIISVIVPFLDEEKYIEQCIIALLSQDFDNNEYEIIMIDNGSTDSSVSVVRKYPRIKLLYESKRCPYAARNQGLRTARGELIAFTDADCVVSRNWLSEIYNGMEKHGAAIAFGTCFFNKPSYWLKLFENYQNAKVSYIIQNNMRSYMFGFTNNMVVRKALFEKYGHFKSNQNTYVGGDTEYVQRCLKKDQYLKVIRLPNMIITHMEIDTVLSWLKKLYLYGENDSYIKREDRLFRGIPLNIRFQMYIKCLHEYKYGFVKKYVALIVIFLGNLFYLTGKAKAYFAPKY